MTYDDKVSATAWAIVVLFAAVLFIPWDWPGKWFSWAVSWYRRRMKQPVR